MSREIGSLRSFGIPMPPPGGGFGLNVSPRFDHHVWPASHKLRADEHPSDRTALRMPGDRAGVPGRKVLFRQSEKVVVERFAGEREQSVAKGGVERSGITGRKNAVDYPIDPGPIHVEEADRLRWQQPRVRYEVAEREVPEQPQIEQPSAQAVRDVDLY